MARATQLERRTDTRQRLLSAAAAVFAERGVEGASVDAIADAAERTCGALYDHFGSKQGLLFELLDSWTSEVASVAEAELLAAHTLDEQLAVLWRNVVNPPHPGGARWVQLEHELWRWASRDGNEEARNRLAARYRDAHRSLATAISAWAHRGLIDPPMAPGALAPMMIGLLIGLEMQHRLDPRIVTDDQAVASLRALIGAAAAGPKKARTR